MTVQKALVWVAALLLAACVFSHTISLRLLLLTLGIVLAATVLARNRELRALPPIWIPFALWATWAALSLTWSFEPERTLKEWRSEVFYTGATLWVCFVAAQARDAAKILLPVVGLATIAACAVALHSATGGWANYQYGWHGGPGNHSSALLMVMPCALMALWNARGRDWSAWMLVAAAAMALIFLASAYATLTRTLWLGFAVELIVLGSLLLLRSRQVIVWRTAMIAAALVLGASTVVLSIQADRESIGAVREFERDPRLALWPQVLQRVAERPLSGYGFGRGILRGPLQQELANVDEQLWHAHNLFLDTMLQLGAAGLLLFLVLLGAIVREGWRLARDADRAAAACGMALIAVVAGMAVRNATDTLLVRQNALLFWGLVGVLLALGARFRAAR
jgi:O-antigen ligase